MKAQITLPPSDQPGEDIEPLPEYALTYGQAADFLARLERLVQSGVETYLAALDPPETPEVYVTAWLQSPTNCLIWLQFFTESREDDLVRAIRSAARTCGGWYEILPEDLWTQIEEMEIWEYPGAEEPSASEATAIAFIEHVNGDPNLLTRVRPLGIGHVDVVGLVEIARDAGYEIDEEGLLRACVRLRWDVGVVRGTVAPWLTTLLGRFFDDL